MSGGEARGPNSWAGASTAPGPIQACPDSLEAKHGKILVVATEKSFPLLYFFLFCVILYA